jgi:hypothetical protein
MFGAIPDVQAPLLIMFVLGTMGVLGIASLWSVFLSAYALYLCLTSSRPEGE